MNRRVLAALGLLAVLLLAGCAEPAGSLRMEPVEDTELAEKASRPTTGGQDYPAVRQQQVVTRAIENGSVTVLDVRDPVNTGLAFEHEDAYYEITHEEVGTREGAETVVGVDYNATEPEGTRIDFADLSAADRRLLGPMLAAEPRELEPGAESRFPLAYTRQEVNDSVLLIYTGESVVISYRGTDYEVSVGRATRGPLQVHRYEATRIAGSAEAFAATLTERYAFTLSGLSDGEESIVESALGDSYYAEDTDDEGFATLVERFRRHEAIENDGGSGNWLVRYDGQLYWVDLYYGAFVADETATTTTPNVTPH